MVKWVIIGLTLVLPGQRALAQGDLAVSEKIAAHEAGRYRLLASSASLPPSDTSVDITYYKLNLAISTAPNGLSGDVTVNALSLRDSLSTVTLDLVSVMTVDSVVIGGSPVGFFQDTTQVTVSLDRNYSTNELVTLDVFYHGLPVPTGFGSFNFDVHLGIPWVWSLSEPYGAKDWWPCKDQPSDKADSADIIITANAAYKVGSNGRLAGVIDNGNGTKTWHWSERYPIAPYLIFVAVTNFDEFSLWFRYSSADSMQVLNYVVPEHLQLAQDSLACVINALSIFSNKFGLYPFINEKYGHAEFKRGGAMEHQTMTSLTDYAMAQDVVVHELGHQWFGDMITCANWGNLWLNEGFATYCESLYHEVMYGESDYRANIEYQMWRARQAEGPLFSYDTTNIPILFAGGRVYGKGGTVLHMLRHVLGDSVFFHAMYAYANDPGLKFNVATTEDFQHVCETVSGEDLQYFFNEWVYGESYPRYTYTWNAQPGAVGWDVDVQINQMTFTNNPSFFTMPIDFSVSREQWDTTVVLFNTVNGQHFTFNVSHEPTMATLDPDRWILRDSTTTSAAVDDDRRTRLHFALRQNHPNPFNPVTTIGFTLQSSGFTMLKIYDILGKEVGTLITQDMQPGRYERQFDGSNLTSGVYFYRLTSGKHMVTRKMLLLK